MEDGHHDRATMGIALDNLFVSRKCNSRKDLVIHYFALVPEAWSLGPSVLGPFLAQMQHWALRFELLIQLGSRTHVSVSL